jgi:RNA polymerase sigma-70 factor, ECF subfamily
VACRGDFEASCFGVVASPADEVGGHRVSHGHPTAGSDGDSAEWIRSLLTKDVSEHETAVARLHELALRFARRELRRTYSPLTCKDDDDIAYQVAADALMAILPKLRTFRGESRFTTWVYRFVMFEVLSLRNRIRRQCRNAPRASMQDGDWESLPDPFNIDPSRHAEGQEQLAAVCRAIEVVLTERQRRLFVAAVVDCVPLDALAIQLGMSRNAVYKSIFDSRRKIRAFLDAEGYPGR